MRKSNKLKLLFIFCFVIMLTLITFKIFGKSDTKVYSISLYDESIKLSVGDVFKIRVKDEGEYKYESENKDVVTVDDSGLITAIKAGTSKVKVSSSSGVETECVVTVSARLNALTTDNYNIILTPNSTKKLDYKLEPNDIKIDKIEWYSSDDKIASVKDGNVTGISVGDTTITLTINDKYRIKYNIMVVDEIEKFTLKASKITLNLNDSKKIDVDIKPSTSDYELLTFKSDDFSIATVDSKGNVTAKKEGKTKVRVSYKDTEKTITIKVKNIKVKSVVLNKNKSTINLSDELKLEATVIPDNASDIDIKWTSSDEKIATVSDGKVIPKKYGTVKITATTSNGKKASCNVTINSNTHGKNAIFFGDSIAFGLASTPKGYGWANYIGDNFDIGKTVNAAKSGWLISNALDNSWINTIVTSYKDQDFDYVILHGGTNDIKHAIDLGSFDKDDFSGNYNEKTFLGGLETYIYTVKKQWPHAKIGYIITFATPNNIENRRKLSAKYYTAMKKVLDKWDIDYLDLYFGKTPSGKSYNDLLKVNTYEYLTDGIHLNLAGYKLLSPYIFDWMNTL